MTAGDAGMRQVQRLEEEARRLRQRADRLEGDAERYRAGSAGERRLADLLAPLEAHGFVVLADRCVPGTEGNIDLLAVGPTGVFVLDAKAWSGRLAVRDGVLTQNGQRRSTAVDGLVAQATVVQQVLAEALAEAVPGSPQPPLYAALCFVGAGAVGGVHHLGPVSLVDADHVTAFLASPQPVLDAAWVEWTATMLAGRLAARTDTRETASDPGTAAAPTEPIVFLDPWRKYGKHYIYVKDENGVAGGYLDVRAAEARRTTPASEAVLRRLLPHYVAADDQLDEAERGLIARFLAWLVSPPSAAPAPQPALMVGTVWRNYGRSRLYVWRLDERDERCDLGWFDLRESRVHAAVPGWEPQIRYCGERYQQARPPAS